ncbi:MAG: hypothetical protein IJ501_00015 [Bacilli bacterium]|nr:hypothetical protein [Bacilli bacterium]
MYTSVDLGSHSIKIVVSEKSGDKFYVLASTKVRSLGIKKGIIKDRDLVIKSLQEAILNINQDLGIEIKKVLLNFPLFCVNTSIETAEIETNGMITGEDIQEVIKKSVLENIKKEEEVLYLEPIVFDIDRELQVVDPKGLTGERLQVRCAVSTIEKNFLYEYLKILSDVGLEVVDITYGVVGDYYESSNRDTNSKLGVVVNFGYGKTEIAIFNKGIMLKGSILPIGSNKIDKDISYIYKVDKKIAIDLKEKFAVAASSYSDKFDIMEVLNIHDEKITINQLEISQIVEARLLEIIKSVKNEINNLTNREISYIIVTGGITNLVGFPYLMDSEFTCDKIIGNITSLGVRSNIYSASFGLIKYFDYKMRFRNIDYSMFSRDEINELTAKKKKVSTKENLLNKFAAYLKN